MPQTRFFFSFDVTFDLETWLKYEPDWARGEGGVMLRATDISDRRTGGRTD